MHVTISHTAILSALLSVQYNSIIITIITIYYCYFISSYSYFFSAVLLTLDLFLSIESVPVELRTSSDETETSVRKRSPTVSERWSCAGASPPPPNRVDTGERLRNLRRQMNLHDIQAYIITSDNAHQVTTSNQYWTHFLDKISCFFCRFLQ